MPGLSIRGLTAERGRARVLEDVSFTAQPGQVTAVLGPAGAGKTTLLAALAGLLPLESGAIFRDGADVTGCKASRRSIAFMQPGHALAASRTVQAAAREAAGRKRGQAADERLAQLGLATLAGRKIGTLSHGQALCALAACRTLIAGEALLVDEAGMGLDAEGASLLLAALRLEALSGRTIVMATRSAPIALAADHLVLLAAGRLLQAGTPASLYAEPCNAEAVRLTGRGNILSGHIRELRPGLFVWAAGSRHVQASDADAPRPALGSPVTLCLRPERLALLAPSLRMDNEVEGTITRVLSCGPMLDVEAMTSLGPLLAQLPSWNTRLAAGQTIRLGWSAQAAQILRA